MHTDSSTIFRISKITDKQIHTGLANLLWLLNSPVFAFGESLLTQGESKHLPECARCCCCPHTGRTEGREQFHSAEQAGQCLVLCFAQLPWSLDLERATVHPEQGPSRQWSKLLSRHPNLAVCCSPWRTWSQILTARALGQFIQNLWECHQINVILEVPRGRGEDSNAQGGRTIAVPRFSTLTFLEVPLFPI